MRIYETEVWCIDSRLEEITGGPTDNEFRKMAFDLEKVSSIRRRTSEEDDPEIIEDGITIIYTVDGEYFITHDKYEDFLNAWKKYHCSTTTEGFLPIRF